MKPVSRRYILESTLAASAATFSGLFTGSSVAGPYAQGSQETVRDRLWIFTVVAGMNNDRLEDGGVRGGSRMTPAEGAFYLGVPNLIMVRERGLPHRPSHEKNWKARTSFEQYAISFRPLKRVVWSVVGSGGNIQGDEVSWVLELAGKFPNIMRRVFGRLLRSKEGRRENSNGRIVTGSAKESSSSTRSLRKTA